jgi:hypothetical protein
MSDFLSNLVIRSFTDAPVIQPRVPSLFEPAAVECFDEMQSSAPVVEVRETIAHANAPGSVSKSWPDSEAGITKPVTEVSDASDTLPEGYQPKPDMRAQQSTPVKITVPLNAFRDWEKDPDNKKPVPEVFSEPPPVGPPRRKDFLPLEHRFSSAPIIRVTIGRVEVRAVQQSEQPRPTQREKPQPGLTLEEYLLQRRQGKR